LINASWEEHSDLLIDPTGPQQQRGVDLMRYPALNPGRSSFALFGDSMSAKENFRELPSPATQEVLEEALDYACEFNGQLHSSPD
jgi:hypothetical protein